MRQLSDPFCKCVSLNLLWCQYRKLELDPRLYTVLGIWLPTYSEYSQYTPNRWIVATPILFHLKLYTKMFMLIETCRRTAGMTYSNLFFEREQRKKSTRADAFPCAHRIIYFQISCLLLLMARCYRRQFKWILLTFQFI